MPPLPPNTGIYLRQAEVRQQVFDEGQKTVRHPSAGLITRAKLNFQYGRISITGKIHYFEYAIIRWNVDPFPQISYIYQCGPQSIVVFPVKPEDIKPFQLCARCFSFRSIRGSEQRKRIWRPWG